ncbi:hypothetical protein [Ruegeria profundi]|uniref:Uncharacterized protein n=1 Tax=Ruegeria profundi TaxID=1685378 RepID=A0A0X3U054_9RHOB|nr:hypothetical protein [Ruegeria profundi]KUJ81328.1 hypothetical protein AVO44_05615 [Ruegeria profundi]
MTSGLKIHAILLGTLFAVMPGCGGNAQDRASKAGALGHSEAADASATQVAAVDSSTYAGRIQVKLDSSISLRDTPVSIPVYAGLQEAGPTRLRLRALVDLRDLQLKAPDILTGPLEESCNRQIYLEVSDIAAQGDNVRVEGATRAQFSRCNRNEEPGLRYFGVTVDVVAVGKAEVRDQCLYFTLDGLDLDPRGLIGGAANIFGITNRIKTAVLEKAGEVLAANPICPPLPESFSVLDPNYESGGTREIEPGGMGGAIVGSVDVSAETLVKLLAGLQERGVLEFAE